MQNKSKSPFKIALSRFIHNKIAMLSIIFLLIITIISIIAPLIAPFPVNQQDLLNIKGEMTAQNILGTDSGGMRQRVMIAMAISCSPKLLIADEPTTALDVTIQAQILDLLKELQKETQMAIMMITHDLSVVAEFCDKVLVMYAGQIVEFGGIKEILHNPKHPYTQKLLSTIPKLKEEQKRLETIEGIVPSIQAFHVNKCRFANRCNKKLDICNNQSPKMHVCEDVIVRCHLYKNEYKEI
ncbi:Oligopeptide transport ATP-binding protein oppD [Staphylococcus aureus]|nr:Oligopeptide transport ATP-binding protein oppD [Staphylococcus aureus]